MLVVLYFAMKPGIFMIFLLIIYIENVHDQEVSQSQSYLESTLLLYFQFYLTSQIVCSIRFIKIL